MSGPETPKGSGQAPPAEFLTLVSTLAAQASIQLGIVANPVTKKVQKDLRGARFAIDMLAMLERKTQGNLTPEEERVLSHILADVRLRYVDASK